MVDMDAEDATTARNYFTSGVALSSRGSSKKSDEGVFGFESDVSNEY